jgi:hypothetical protein
LILLAGISLVTGCKKSSESDAPNFFGSPPVVSELSITKEAATFACISPVAVLCCVDPPLCTCCCQPDTVNQVTAQLDLVQISAKVTDADGAANLLVVLARFFDPPAGSSGGNAVEEISLEMFDVGPNAVGTVTTTNGVYPVISGDAVQGDGVYTRYFYMKSDTSAQPDDCILSTDTTDHLGTYSQFTTTVTFPATNILNYQYHVEAVDRAGNIAPSGNITLPILRSVVTKTSTTEACGPPTGNGGCAAPTP